MAYAMGFVLSLLTELVSSRAAFGNAEAARESPEGAVELSPRRKPWECATSGICSPEGAKEKDTGNYARGRERTKQAPSATVWSR